MTTARAYSNIAFIKYWGNTDDNLRLPVNPSLSMNLDGLYTETTVTWRQDIPSDELTLNGNRATGPALERVSHYLEKLRGLYNITEFAEVISENNFPIGVGIASSASAFAALALSATHAAGLKLGEKELSTLARLGSGSASRSIPNGFVQWEPGTTHEESYATSIAPSDHWTLVDLIAIVDTAHKKVGSTQGHKLASSSTLQEARVKSCPARFESCKSALLNKDFDEMATIVELDSDMMHAVMMTSSPPLMYWQPTSVAVMKAVRTWRAEGLRVFYTLDAGPNVHCLCLENDVPTIKQRLNDVPGVNRVIEARPGQSAHVVAT